MPPSRGGCKACPTGKHRYRDRVGALVALADSLSKPSGNRNEVRAYHCPQCSGWHLTSKALYERPQLGPPTPSERRPYEAPQMEEQRLNQRGKPGGEGTS